MTVVLSTHNQRRAVAPKKDCPPLDDRTEDTHDVISDDADDDSVDDVFDLKFAGFLSSKTSSRGLPDEGELLPTFNSLIRRSQSVHTENISAVGILEKEKEIQRKLSQRSSIPVQEFMEARVDTFTRNVDFVQYQADNFLRRSLVVAEVSTNSKRINGGQAQVDMTKRASSQVELGILAGRSFDFGPVFSKEYIQSQAQSQSQTQTRQTSTSFDLFLQDRLGTFVRNVNFLQREAEALAQSVANVLEGRRTHSD